MMKILRIAMPAACLLARKNIKVVVNLLHADGSRILGVEQSPESCAKFT